VVVLSVFDKKLSTVTIRISQFLSKPAELFCSRVLRFYEIFQSKESAIIQNDGALFDYMRFFIRSVISLSRQ